MKLILGGAFQGKNDYAQTHFPDMKTVPEFHMLVLDQMQSGISPTQHFQEHLEEYRDKVLICEDLFCGVVPVDQTMRAWREELGRTLALASKECDEVVRVFCGLGTRIK